MQVICDDCGTQYNIPEAKITREVSRATCKKCGAKMIITRQGSRNADVDREEVVNHDERTVIAQVPELDDYQASAPVTGGSMMEEALQRFQGRSASAAVQQAAPEAPKAASMPVVPESMSPGPAMAPMSAKANIPANAPMEAVASVANAPVEAASVASAPVEAAASVPASAPVEAVASVPASTPVAASTGTHVEPVSAARENAPSEMRAVASAPVSSLSVQAAEADEISDLEEEVQVVSKKASKRETATSEHKTAKKAQASSEKSSESRSSRVESPKAERHAQTSAASPRAERQAAPSMEKAAQRPRPAWPIDPVLPPARSHQGNARQGGQSAKTVRGGMPVQPSGKHATSSASRAPQSRPVTPVEAAPESREKLLKRSLGVLAISLAGVLVLILSST